MDAPWHRCRKLRKANALSRPLCELGSYVFGHQCDAGATAHHARLEAVDSLDQRKDRGFVNGRTHGNPSSPLLRAGIDHNLEAQPVAVKGEAYVLIPNVDFYDVDLEVAVAVCHLLNRVGRSEEHTSELQSLRHLV